MKAENADTRRKEAAQMLEIGQWNSICFCTRRQRFVIAAVTKDLFENNGSARLTLIDSFYSMTNSRSGQQRIKTTLFKREQSPHLWQWQFLDRRIFVSIFFFKWQSSLRLRNMAKCIKQNNDEAFVTMHDSAFDRKALVNYLEWTVPVLYMTDICAIWSLTFPQRHRWASGQGCRKRFHQSDHVSDSVTFFFRSRPLLCHFWSSDVAAACSAPPRSYLLILIAVLLFSKVSLYYFLFFRRVAVA